MDFQCSLRTRFQNRFSPPLTNKTLSVELVGADAKGKTTLVSHAGVGPHFLDNEVCIIPSWDTEILSKTLDNSGLPYRNASINMANIMSDSGCSASSVLIRNDSVMILTVP